MADLHRQIVRQKLEAIGYAITEIPEGERPSADLAASGLDVGLVVEVKARRDDIENARQFHSGSAGRVVESRSPIGHDDALSRVVHHAANQISSSQEQYFGLGVLWFRADPDLGISHAAARIVTTLFGRRYLNVRGTDGIITTGRCYLAGYADFYRCSSIDLAVVEDPDDSAYLLVNPYSRRLDDVHASRLFTFAAGEMPWAIIDLHKLEASANDYVLWGEFSRKAEATVLEELKKRYPDRDFQLFDMCSSIGRIRMDT